MSNCQRCKKGELFCDVDARSNFQGCFELYRIPPKDRRDEKSNSAISLEGYQNDSQNDRHEWYSLCRCGLSKASSERSPFLLRPEQHLDAQMLYLAKFFTRLVLAFEESTTAIDKKAKSRQHQGAIHSAHCSYWRKNGRNSRRIPWCFRFQSRIKPRSNSSFLTKRRNWGSNNLGPLFEKYGSKSKFSANFNADRTRIFQPVQWPRGRCLYEYEFAAGRDSIYGLWNGADDVSRIWARHEHCIEQNQILVFVGGARNAWHDRDTFTLHRTFPHRLPVCEVVRIGSVSKGNCKQGLRRENWNETYLKKCFLKDAVLQLNFWIHRTWGKFVLYGSRCWIPRIWSSWLNKCRIITRYKSETP